jgi:hypothetical protein
MTTTARCVAFWVALFSVFAISANAQQAEQSAENSYLPPSQFIAKTPAAAGQRSAAAPSTAEARPTAQARSAAAPAPKTVGVLSVVGETFRVKRIGMTVFGNEEEKFPVAAWKVDDKVVESVNRVLKKTFRTKRIQIPAGAFTKFRDGDFLFKSFEDELAKFIAQFTAGQKCDYYLLVSPGYSQIGSTNQGIYGLGVVRWDHIFAPGEYVHALSMLTVYDTQMKQLRSQFSTIGQETFMVAVKGPHQELKEGDKLPPEAKAAAADPRAQKLTWELLDKSLAMTLPKLFAAN